MRIQVYGLACVLVLLPLFGDRVPPSSAPAVAVNATRLVATDPQISSVQPWLEFTKIFAPTFLGAFLAFLASLEIHRRNSMKAERGAGMHAFTTLASQYATFRAVRRASEQQYADIRAQSNVPAWIGIRPFAHFRQSGLSYDFSALAFLCDDREGLEAMRLLRFMEAYFSNFLGTVERITELAQEKQQAAEKSGMKAGQIPISEFESAVGLRIKHALISYLESLDEQLAEGEREFEKAHAALRAALVARFGSSPPVPRIVFSK